MSVKALSAVVPPNMTTTQRNAIPAGRRPPGSVIYNTTNKCLETNMGTDATPSWVYGGNGPVCAAIMSITGVTADTNFRIYSTGQTILVDSDGMLATNDGHITAKTAGVYTFNAMIQGPTTAGYCGWKWIHSNGSLYGGSNPYLYMGGDASHPVFSSMSTVYNMAANDYMYIAGFASQGGSWSFRVVAQRIG